uniref:Uncharacterized protein n=1 Tax=Panagrolaimus sp. ES5 TaxID=591445 RepID=A0AC34G3F3_9BILA
MPDEKTVDTEKTVKTLNPTKDDGQYANLDLTVPDYVTEKSAIKTTKPKQSKDARLQDRTSKKSKDVRSQERTTKKSRPIQQESTAKRVRGRTDPLEAPPSSYTVVEDGRPPESEGNSEYFSDAKRESASCENTKDPKKVVVQERLTSSAPTANKKKKKIGCCTLL